MHGILSGEIHQAAGNTEMEILGAIRTDVDVCTEVIVEVMSDDENSKGEI